MRGRRQHRGRAWTSPRFAAGTWAAVPDYALLVTPPAQRALDRLPERVAAAIAELLTRALLAAPRRAAARGRGCSLSRAGAGRVGYGSFQSRPVTVVLVRDEATTSGYDLALVTTDTAVGLAHVYVGSDIRR